MDKMNLEPIPNVQLPLFVYGEPAENLAELLPVVWNATQALISLDPIIRSRGLDAVLELGAQRASPLVAYLIAACIDDADMHIRRRAIYIVADLIAIDAGGLPANEEIRKVIISYLRYASDKIVYSLLEVALIDPFSEASIYQVFNVCPLAGKALGEILADGKNPMPIRLKATHFVGWIGYAETLPILKRLLDRLEGRRSEQYAMTFAPRSRHLDDELIPVLRIAINRLTSA
jgi:hypothetical protein